MPKWDTSSSMVWPIGALMGVDYLKKELDDDQIKYQYKGAQYEWTYNETATANAFRFGLELGYFFDFGSMAVPFVPFSRAVTS